MDMETNLKIKQRQDFMKQNYKKSVDGSTSGAIYDGKQIVETIIILIIQQIQP